MKHVRRSPARFVALTVFLVMGAGLTLAQPAPRRLLSERIAVQDVERDARDAQVLRSVRWDRASVDAVDRQLVRVSFFKGDRILFEAAVSPNGSVAHFADFTRIAVPYGSPIAYEPIVLAGLALLFIVMTAVAPLTRLRNLDVLALLSFLGPVVLLQKHYAAASVLAAVPGLVYLTGRCAWRGLGPADEAPPAQPLHVFLTPSWEVTERNRVLRMLALALALVFLMVSVSSTGVDVVYAVMEGATKILHGVLPYGHLPGEVVHGDTYPVLSYLFYTPLAALAPVSSSWDSVDLALGVTALAALLVAALAFSAGAGPRPGRGQRREPETETHGLQAAIAWLAFPPLLITASTGTTDVMLAAMLAFAVVLWRRPALSSGILAAAGWFKLAPFALVPLWIAPLRGRRLLAALGAIAGVCAVMVAVVLGIGGPNGLTAMAHAVSYQFRRGSSQSAWAALGIQPLQPTGQALVLALIAGACVRLRRDPELAADPRRVAALAAATLLGLQLTADYWAFLYLAWVVPLIGMSLLAGKPSAEPCASPIRAAPSALAGSSSAAMRRPPVAAL